jgi:hypothetical protein
VLVAAVLRPEQREDGELEVVGVALEQGPNALVLPIREAEGAMERLFRDAAQTASLTTASDCLGRVPARDGRGARVASEQ